MHTIKKTAMLAVKLDLLLKKLVPSNKYTLQSKP
jgi:hypothetical protein